MTCVADDSLDDADWVPTSDMSDVEACSYSSDTASEHGL